jgi:hypothetical protein
VSRNLTASLLIAIAAAAALLAPASGAAKTYGGADRDVPLARFQDPLCPGIFGVQKASAEGMVGLIRQNAAELGLRLADPETCEPNLLVAVMDDPHGYIDGLRKRRGYVFEDLTQGERRVLFDSPGPVHTWTRVQLSSMGGIPVDQRRNLTDLPQAAVMAGHSLIYVPVRRDITSALVLIDRQAVAGMSVAQLADYATMRGLSGDQAEQLDAPGESILTLFDADGTAKPAGLTRSDRIFLQTLYSTIPNNPAAITLAMADARIAGSKAAE